jgi:hypothetical protein
MSDQVFISKPYEGQVFVAERARRSRRLLWSVMPEKRIVADRRIDPAYVPYHIRRQAYRLFYSDTVRAQGERKVR